MNGAVGRLIPFTVKQSVQSSPKGTLSKGVKVEVSAPAHKLCIGFEPIK